MKDKEKLKKLITIVGNLAKIEGNEWLINELLHSIGDGAISDKSSNYPIINEIYEHCIKKVIEKQAIDFYSRFPYRNEQLIEKLIYDFIEMEYNYRRDRFYEFSFCLNQQIEGIVNHLFDTKYENEWQNLNSEIKNSIFIKYKDIENTLQDLIISKDKENKNQWSDLSKFKVVYYFLSKTNNHKLPFDFKRMRDTKQEISIARNESHRGSSKYDWQKKILNSIEGNESRYYFKFYGFLHDFMAKIEAKYVVSEKSKKNPPKNKSNKPSKDTIGANNPELEKLKQMMNKK